MKRIINYLLFVSKNIDNYNWETNKELLLKIFEYLKEYKITSPIEFLKVSLKNMEFTNLSIMYVFEFVFVENQPGNYD